MRTIGLLGGMTWESSIEYERIINEEVRRRLGGNHSADLVVRSYDFVRIEALQESGRWEEAGALLAADARRLQEAGADLIVLCTNTMHQVADAIVSGIDVPFIHIGEATVAAVRSAGVSSVALLGTRYTMEQDFYRGHLESAGLDVLAPDRADRNEVHRIIFEELASGKIYPASRERVLGIIDRLVDRGAVGVIAGCTEIELLVTPEDVAGPYFPTARIHALAAVDAALSR